MIMAMKFLFLIIPLLSYGAETNSDGRTGKVIYKYKEVQEFNMEEIGVGGDNLSPGDLSIISRTQVGVEVLMPTKPTFNREIKYSVERIR